MKRTTVDLWVGVFVAAGLVALLVLALKVGNASTRLTRPTAISVYGRVRQHRRPQGAGAGEERRRGGRAGGGIRFDNRSSRPR